MLVVVKGGRGPMGEGWRLTLKVGRGAVGRLGWGRVEVRMCRRVIGFPLLVWCMQRRWRRWGVKVARPKLESGTMRGKGRERVG